MINALDRLMVSRSALCPLLEIEEIDTKSSKTVTIGSLFLIGVLASIGATAHADNINTSGVICQNFNAAQALDIDYLSTGVRNLNAVPRQVICSVPRSPASFLGPFFIVHGRNNSNTSTACTLFATNTSGVTVASTNFTETTGTEPLSWAVPVLFSPDLVTDSDYVNLLCTIPGSGAGTIRGITSIQ